MRLDGDVALGIAMGKETYKRPLFSLGIFGRSKIAGTKGVVLLYCVALCKATANGRVSQK